VPRLLAISDRSSLGEELPAWLRRLVAAGLRAVQLREKDLADGDLLALARTARTVAPPPVTLLVNGRLDVALAAGADGVHLPAAGLPAGPLRALAGRHGWAPLVGRSTHTLVEVVAARDEGVDYVTFGPVFASPGKGPAVGLAALAVAARQGVPVLALGGVGRGEVGAVAATGAWGLAGIRCFRDPEAAAELVALAGRAFAPAPP
jgi:thiamine-phosphate pyrophosphorylase